MRLVGCCRTDGVARKVLLVAVLCAVLCLVAEAANAASRDAADSNRKNGNKNRAKTKRTKWQQRRRRKTTDSRRRQQKQGEGVVPTEDNAVTIPNVEIDAADDSSSTVKTSLKSLQISESTAGSTAPISAKKKEKKKEGKPKKSKGGGGGGGEGGAARDSTKPHIIIVVADDLGYNDVGYHTPGTGCVARTPNIDNLAFGGVRLENYYVQSICTPTRASLMTGRYPVRILITFSPTQHIFLNERSKIKSSKVQRLYNDLL